jgi:hypothetical protein
MVQDGILFSRLCSIALSKKHPCYLSIEIYLFEQIGGCGENYDVNINMHVHITSCGTVDDWLNYGNSTAAGAMGHLTLNGVKNFAQLNNFQALNISLRMTTFTQPLRDLARIANNGHI